MRIKDKTNRSRLFRTAVLLAVFYAAGATAWAEDLVELELVSRRRAFTPQNPVESIAQDFRITGPGILTVEWVSEPHQGANGGFGIKAKDGSPLYLGRESVRAEAPKPLVVGSRYSLRQVIIVPKATQPLEAYLTAWWAPQAMQILNYGEQLPAKQRLTVRFAPIGQATAASTQPAAVDISGTWRYDSGAGANLTFTAKGGGLYDVVENGYGNGRGTARVSGRTVTIEYVNTRAYGSQKSGVYALEVGADNKTMAGGWLTDNGENGSTSLTRTTPVPAGPPPAQPQPPALPAAAQKGGTGYGAQADPFRGRNGERFVFTCPAGASPSDRLWGTDLYTDDCSICTAAVHAGLITLQKGGDVVIEIRPGAAAYKGSLRNGIQSGDWGAFSGSFVFVGSAAAPSPAPAPAVVRRGGSGYGAQANPWRGQNGERFAFECPPNAAPSSRVWGTDQYTDDCSVCTAAVHAGLISLKTGGIVVIEIRPGASSYKGSLRNGIQSGDWGAFEGSFVFIGTTEEYPR